MILAQFMRVELNLNDLNNWFSTHAMHVYQLLYIYARYHLVYGYVLLNQLKMSRFYVNRFHSLLDLFFVPFLVPYAEHVPKTSRLPYLGICVIFMSC